MAKQNDSGTVRRVRWYRTVYSLAYRLRATVWRRPLPPAELIDLVEGQERLTPGRALDLGCGTGTDSIYLASRGWEVIGIDAVPRALEIARRDASAAGVSPRFLHGDVTRLETLGIGDGFNLLFDFGCFHTLPEDQRDQYVHAVSRVTAPGGILLLYGFTRPPKVAPMHAGISTEEILRRFAAWRIVNSGRVSPEALGVPASRTGVQFDLWGYRLQLADAAEGGEG